MLNFINICAIEAKLLYIYLTIPSDGAKIFLNSVTFQYNMNCNQLTFVHPYFSERHYIYSAHNHIQYRLLNNNRCYEIVDVVEINMINCKYYYDLINLTSFNLNIFVKYKSSLDALPKM